MKPLLAATAVLVALLVAVVSGGVLTSTGDEPPARADVARVAAGEDEKSHGRAGGNPAAHAFVAAKKEWTACVADAAPARDRADGRFDPEQACGTKPHPHDIAGKGPKPGAKHGRPRR